jgi:hypothetical protein
VVALVDLVGEGTLAPPGLIEDGATLVRERLLGALDDRLGSVLLDRVGDDEHHLVAAHAAPPPVSPRGGAPDGPRAGARRHAIRSRGAVPTAPVERVLVTVVRTAARHRPLAGGTPEPYRTPRPDHNRTLGRRRDTRKGRSGACGEPRSRPLRPLRRSRRAHRSRSRHALPRGAPP